MGVAEDEVVLQYYMYGLSQLLIPLQSSNISDPSLDGTKEDQHSNNGDSDNSDYNDPRRDVERKDIEFLVPDYNNQPDYDDISVGSGVAERPLHSIFSITQKAFVHLSNEPFVKCNYLIVINMLACLRDSHIRRIVKDMDLCIYLLV